MREIPLRVPIKPLYKELIDRFMVIEPPFGGLPGALEVVFQPQKHVLFLRQLYKRKVGNRLQPHYPGYDEPGTGYTLIVFDIPERPHLQYRRKSRTRSRSSRPLSER